MKLTQVRGNTWVAEGIEYIPFYRLENGGCVLLDSGLLEEREDLESSLLAAGLTPAGVLCSHAHIDHCASNRYFQEKYGAKVALTAPEAGMCSSLLTLKCYFLLLSPGMVAENSACMIHTPDVLVPPEDGPFSFAGAEFGIVHTPGHSAGHISVVTPDRVCYTGDALLSREMMSSKLPYDLSHGHATASREKLRHLDCDLFLMAHRGVCTAAEVGELIDENQDLVRRREEEILALITRSMSASEIVAAVCQYYKLLSHKPARSLRFERNVRFFLEHLTDEGRLQLECVEGVTHYRRP